MTGATAILEPGDVVITPALHERPPRPANLRGDLDAYHELASLMTADPVLAIQRVLDLAVELCPAAGSAGLSELTEDADGQAVFELTVASGTVAPLAGGRAPRDSSTCGLCLDHRQTILVERPARLFNDAGPEIAEGLIVPLYDTSEQPLGALWVASHDEGARFGPTDARLMEQLAVQLVLAIKLRSEAAALAELEQAVRDKEMALHEIRHRVRNMIQMTSGLLQLQERGLEPGEARAALREAQSRQLVLTSVHEALTRPEARALHVDMAALIQTLVAALRAASEHGRRVAVRTECAKLLVDVGQAVPLGLIVNEAVTNALKHAFAPGGDGPGEGEVVVSLGTSGAACRLAIRDNGAGFGKPHREGGLGLRLINNLARQLRGKLSIDGSDGTRVELEWAAAP